MWRAGQFSRVPGDFKVILLSLWFSIFIYFLLCCLKAKITPGVEGESQQRVHHMWSNWNWNWNQEYWGGCVGGGVDVDEYMTSLGSYMLQRNIFWGRGEEDLTTPFSHSTCDSSFVTEKHPEVILSCLCNTSFSSHLSLPLLSLGYSYNAICFIDVFAAFLLYNF